MPLKSIFVETTILCGLIVWGLWSSLQGMGLSFFVSGTNQYRDESFIELLYLSVITAALIALLSPRVAAFLSAVIGVVLVAMVLTTDLGHDPDIAKQFMWSIIWRPFLAAVILFPLPRIGPFGRFLLRRRKPADE